MLFDVEERIRLNKKRIAENKRMIRQNNVVLAFVIPFLVIGLVCIIMAVLSK